MPSGASFSRLLLRWHRQSNNRQMPWKGEKDPYRIWLSEIILQQTRVEQGMSYYHRFVAAFPTISHLAKAPDEKVFKLWEGLGYYSRCRNLLATARFIQKEYKGRFPSSYEEILALKGVGPYTAAAISSFAFQLPYAVVDGNVYRVLARYFGIATPIDSTAGKKAFSALAASLLDTRSPGEYNQAIMDFGAVVCKPVAPHCPGCPLKKQCVAYASGRTAELPEKEKKTAVRKRWFYYLLLEHQNRFAIRQRTMKDIWQDLYEFPLVETEKETPVQDILRLAEENKWFERRNMEVVSVSPRLRQQLSHQVIAGKFIHLRTDRKIKGEPGWKWVEKKEWKRFAFPQFINQYLKKSSEQMTGL